MGGTIIHGQLRVIELHEAELQATGKTIAAADTVEDFERGVLAAFIKPTGMPEDGGPVVVDSRVDAAQSGGGHLEVGEVFDRIALNAPVSMEVR